VEDEEPAHVAGAQRGEPAAIAWLYDRYFDRIYRYVLFKLGNPHEAEDIAESVFLRMIEAIGGFQWQGASFAAWLYRIAHNQIVDVLRQRTRRPQVDLDPLATLLVAETGDPLRAQAAAEPVDAGVQVAHREADVVYAGQAQFCRLLSHPDSSCGIASIIDPLSRHGASERLLQA